MNRLDVENYGKDFPESTSMQILSSLLKSDTPWLFKAPSFGKLVGLIRNEEIFNDVLLIATELDLLKGHQELDEKLNAVKFENLERYQRAKSICYGELIQYNAGEKFWKLLNFNPKDLIIEVTEGTVFSNLQDIEESAGKDNVMREKSRLLNMSPQDATFETNRILSFINDIHYRFDTKLFKKEKKYYKDLKPLLSTLSTPVKINGAPGRPKISNKNAVHYLVNYDDNNAEKYIQTLKNLLLSDTFFQNFPSPKKFNYLLFALHELGDINLNFGEIENIFGAFKQELSKEYLKTCKHKGSIQNFRNQEKAAKDNKLLKKIKSLIVDLKEENVIIRKSKLL